MYNTHMALVPNTLAIRQQDIMEQISFESFIVQNKKYYNCLIFPYSVFDSAKVNKKKDITNITDFHKPCERHFFIAQIASYTISQHSNDVKQSHLMPL